LLFSIKFRFISTAALSKQKFPGWKNHGQTYITHNFSIASLPIPHFSVVFFTCTFLGHFAWFYAFSSALCALGQQQLA